MQFYGEHMGRNLQDPWGGTSVTQMVAKILDPCTLEMKLRVNQISMNDDVGTSVCATSLVRSPLMMPSLWSTSFGSL